MPYLFVSDGAPEADEYSSNYFWFEADDPASLQRALDEAHGRTGAATARAAPLLRLRPTRFHDDHSHRGARFEG